MRHRFGVIQMGVTKYDPATTPPRIYAAGKSGGAVVVTEAVARHFKAKGFNVEAVTATPVEAGWVNRFIRPMDRTEPVEVKSGSPLWLLTCSGGKSAVMREEGGGRRCGAPKGLQRVPGTEALSSGEMSGRELREEVREEYPQGDAPWEELAELGGTEGTGIEIGGAIEFEAPAFPPGAGGEGESPGGGGGRAGGFIPAGMAPDVVEDAARAFAFYQQMETGNTELKEYIAATKVVPFQSDASVLHRTDMVLVEYAQPVALLKENGWGSGEPARGAREVSGLFREPAGHQSNHHDCGGGQRGGCTHCHCSRGHELSRGPKRGHQAEAEALPGGHGHRAEPRLDRAGAEGGYQAAQGLQGARRESRRSRGCPGCPGACRLGRGRHWRTVARRNDHHRWGRCRWTPVTPTPTAPETPTTSTADPD